MPPRRVIDAETVGREGSRRSEQEHTIITQQQVITTHPVGSISLGESGFNVGLPSIITEPIGAVVGAVGAAVDAAAATVVGQAVGAVLTGGVTLAGQAIHAAVTGESNNFTRAVDGAIEDPVGTLTQLPGIALTEGGVGLFITGAEIATKAAGELVGSETLTTVGDVISEAREAAREDPVAVAQLAVSVATGNTGGIAAALADLGVGTAVNFVEEFSASPPDIGPSVEFAPDGPILLGPALYPPAPIVRIIRRQDDGTVRAF